MLFRSAGDTVSSVFTVLSGWAFRFKVLPDGHRRILSYYIPGDFLATEALLNPHVNFSIEALTDMSLCVFDRDKLLALVDENRALRQKVIYLCSRKLESLDNRIAYIGTRPAGEKLAHFFMHFYGRLVRKGLIAGDRFELPLRHEHIADTLGLTSVHVSRTLSELKRAGLIEIQNHAIHILDQPSMLMLAGLDSDYLSKAYAERKAS